MACSADIRSQKLDTLYSYTPLRQPQSFRLLRILPVSRDAKKLECTLEEWKRTEAPRPSYTALSYVWGDLSNKRRITLNGRPAFITENLHDALIHLRDSFPDSFLWVDAVCINQHDQLERSQQVSQMRAIYHDAASVISWLGPRRGEIARLFAFMEEHRRRYSPAIDGDDDIEVISDRELEDALRYLDERPYWNRIWVIQEMVVAKKLTLMCGDHFIDWLTFAGFHSLVHSGSIEWPQMKADGWVVRSTWNDTISRIKTWPCFKVDLSLVLELSRTSLATDERDKVFALLGLVDTGAGQHIAADYAQSACVVYCAATEALAEDWSQTPNLHGGFGLLAVHQRLDDMLRDCGQDQTEMNSGPCNNVARLRQRLDSTLGALVRTVEFGDDSLRASSSCEGTMCGSKAALHTAISWNHYMRR